ncbi:MAG: helix-turn-helix domain-containing protein [Pyrinomonadaceae bacterium]
MLGSELKEKRESLDMTQVKLAEILDVKPNTVARWENGVLQVPKTVELAMETVERKFKTKSA